jgi:hypothetical protein
LALYYSFSFTIGSPSLQFLEGIIPVSGEAVVPIDDNILFCIANEDGYVDLNYLDAYVNGNLVFDGNTFYHPFNVGSQVAPSSSIDGYDAYCIVLNSSVDFPYSSVIPVRVVSVNNGVTLNQTWDFRTESSPPYIEGEFPSPGSTLVLKDTDISFLVVDPDGYIDVSTIDAYVNGTLVCEGGIFYPPFTGTITPTLSVDGYNAYQIVLDRTSDFLSNEIVSVQAYADSYGGYTQAIPYWNGFSWNQFSWETSVDDYSSTSSSWSFTTSPFDVSAPLILNRSPSPGATNVSTAALISFDAVDSQTDVQLSTLQVQVNGNNALLGTSFIAPYNGPFSSITPTIAGGYDGYHIDIDSSIIYSGSVTVSAYIEDAYGSSVNSNWSFRCSDSVNVLYFSDGYGLKAIEVADLVGESQDSIRTILTTTTIPALPSNDIKFIHGNHIDEYNYLALSFDNAPGVVIVKQENSLNEYLDAYGAAKAHITTDGTLYVINRNLNQIEAYYGANLRPGTGRAPDYVYNETSTPPIFGGTILDLHVVDGFSSVFEDGTRFYVGTTLGATRVETYDKNEDGYGLGFDGYGISFTYGIVGSGATYEAVGGSVASCTKVSSDDERLVMIIGTDDGAENGGITQISISGNRKILFLNKANGFLPSNIINDIFGKAY